MIKACGWLVLDKPEGLSSAHAVGRIKRLFGGLKVGHGGTLDPFACGVLPIAIGEATKTSQYVMAADKAYTFNLSFGCETDTLDREGTAVHTGGRRPSSAEIAAVLGSFRGGISQIPPAFSALKVNGRRAYRLSRQGSPPDLKARDVEIFDLACTGSPQAGVWSFDVRCGKGMYVRSLGRDIARALGSYGHISFLRRRRVGIFDEKNAFSFDILERMGQTEPGGYERLLLSLEAVLVDIPALAVTADQARQLRFGQILPLAAFPQLRGEFSEGQDLRAVFSEKLVAIVQKTAAGFVSKRGFNFFDP